jgi:PAS domain S-box-containing protein
VTPSHDVAQDLREREEQLGLALDAAHRGTWELDVTTGELSWGRRMAELHGHTRATAPPTWEAFLERVDPMDRERVQSTLDELLARPPEDDARLDVEFRYLRPDGARRWVDRQGVVLRGTEGEPLRVVGLGSDVDERKTAEQTLRFLAEASEILSGSLDYRETLSQLSALVVPRMADWCAIHIKTPDGLESVAVAHSDAERVRAARELEARYPSDPDAVTGPPNVVRTGRSELYEEISEAMLEAAARDPEHLALLRGLGFSSALIVPLTAHRRTLGSITFVQAESSRRYGPAELAVAEELGRRAALAVDNARLYQEANEQREAAERLRDSLDRVLLVAPRLAQPSSTPAQVAAIVCHAAREVFGCHMASWWEVRDDRLVLVARSPRVGEEPTTSFSLDDAPDVRSEVVDQRRPSFVADIGDRYAPDAAEAYAQRTQVRASLRIPAIGPAGVTDMLALSWREPVDPPSEETTVVAQRFADQAALALEQSRRRAAQREAERLSAALDRLLQTSPRLRAEGGQDEVARTICEAAVTTFSCNSATLWEAEDETFRLVAHVPATGERPPTVRVPRDAMPHASVPRPTFIPDVENPAELVPGDPAGHRVRALLHLPLLHGEAIEGFLTLGWWHPVERPERAWTVIAQRFADQAVLALEEARRREAQEEAARLHAQLERGLLPTVAIDDERVEIHTRYLPGEDRMLLGGDFQDALRLPDGRLALLIGDVSGHGPRAAALGATLRAAWRGLVLLGAGTTQLIAPLDAVLTHERDSDEMFATVCVVWIDLAAGQATLASAGHGAPLLIGSRGVRTLAVEHAPPLGTTSRPTWRPTIVSLPPEFSILLYTDGLVEGRAAPGSPERYGLDRLARLVSRVSRQTRGSELLDALLEDVRAANGGDPADDIALLLVSER